jgi:SAM-dependent methyltransferase
MNLSVDDWHARFVQQASWTQELRSYLYPQINLESARRILSVGCGTGALLPELTERTAGQVVGLDLDILFLKMAVRNSPRADFCGGDAHTLPFPDNSFQIALCHFLLMWVREPLAVVREMLRVTQPGGAVLALAEPDYGGRIDHPSSLERLKGLQIQALRAQGADPCLGRKLRAIFSQSEIISLTTGVLGGEWSGPLSSQEFRQEWTMVAADLRERLSPEELTALKDAAHQAWEEDRRTLFVPTFYAWGLKPG